MEQIVEVEETVIPETKRFTATITLTNSKKVGFSRRDLALCFYPRNVVEKADRNYEVVSIDSRIVPFDNPRLVRRIWEIVQQRYIYDGTVKKVQRHSFDWFKIVKRLKRDYSLHGFYVGPERHTIITEIKITTDTPTQSAHEQVVAEIYSHIRQNAPHLRLKKSCAYNVEGTCYYESE